jgi:hypothetical protein
MQTASTGKILYAFTCVCLGAGLVRRDLLAISQTFCGSYLTLSISERCRWPSLVTGLDVLRSPSFPLTKHSLFFFDDTLRYCPQLLGFIDRSILISLVSCSCLIGSLRPSRLVPPPYSEQSILSMSTSKDSASRIEDLRSRANRVTRRRA